MHFPKRTLDKLLCSTAFAIVVVFLVVRHDEQPPRMSADQRMHDFGELEGGEVVEHSFRIRNCGFGQLRVTDVHAGCTCMSANVTKTILEKDEEAVLRVVFTVPPSTIKSAAKVIVNTNDPATPTAVFRVTGKVSPVLEVSPARIDLGILSGKRNEVARREAVILAKTTDGMRAEVVRNETPSSVSAELRHDARGSRLIVSIAEQAPIGPISASVKVVAGGQATQVAVRGLVVGCVRANPSVLSFHATSPRDPCHFRSEIVAVDENRPIDSTTVVGVTGDIEPYIDTTVFQEQDRQFLGITVMPEVWSTQRTAFIGRVHLQCVGENTSARIDIPVELYTASRRSEVQHHSGK